MKRSIGKRLLDYLRVTTTFKFFYLKSVISFTLFFAWGFLNPAYAQFKTSFDQLTSVTQIHQDKSGFLWAINQFGLHRFDGHSVVTFNNLSTHNPVQFNWITHISPYKDSFLLSTMKQGIWLFDPAAITFQQIYKTVNDETVHDASLLNGILYFTTSRGVHSYQEINGETQHLFDDEPGEEIFEMQGSLFISTPNKILKVIPGSSKVEVIFSGPSYGISMTEDRLIFQSGANIILLNSAGNIVGSREIDYDSTATAWSHRFEAFWQVDSDSNIHLLDPNTLLPLPHRLPSLSKDEVFGFLMEDQSGKIWLSNYVNIFGITDSDFRQFDTVTDTLYLVFHQAFNKFWVGTWGDGVGWFDGTELHLFEAINQHLKGSARRIDGIVSVGSYLIIATWDGVYRYNYNTRQVDRLYTELETQLFLDINAIDEHLYLSIDDGGLAIINARTLEIEEILTAKQHGLSDNEANDITKDHDGNLWIATASGLDKYDTSNKTITSITRSTSSKYMEVLYANNKIYAGTFGEGLHIFNLKGQLINMLHTGYQIYDLAIIENNLWIGSSQGIFMLNPATDLPEMMPGSHLLKVNGNFVDYKGNGYIGVYKGMIKFSLNASFPFKPSIVASEARINGKPTLHTDLITLDSNSNTISLVLASLDYRNTSLHQFRYKINKGEWVDVYESSLTLTNLQSGNYRIEIQGTNSYGEWSDKKGIVNIRVNPPWYQTLTAKLIWLVMVMVVIAWGIWIMVLKARTLSNLNTMLVREGESRRSAVMSSKSSLHRIKELMLSSDNIDRSSVIAICDNSLSALEDQSNRYVPDHLDERSLSSALPYMLEYFRQTFRIRIELKFDIDQELLTKSLEQDIYKVVFETLTHAAINSERAGFELTIKFFHQRVWVILHEEGEGLRTLKMSSPDNLGLFVLKNIIERYNGRIEITPRKPIGTTATISLPVEVIM